MGTLVKRHLAPLWGIDPARLYHCAVMPCYDKKLEASRDDFNLPGTRLTITLVTTSVLAAGAIAVDVPFRAVDVLAQLFAAQKHTGAVSFQTSQRRC